MASSPSRRTRPARDRSSRGGPGRPRTGRRATRADPARRVAYDVLWAVDQRDAYANLLLPALLRERGIEGRDAALATELTYGTLRGLQTYDAILNQCSDRSPGDIDPPVREVLRLGTHQLLATRVASHAAVATSVDLAKDVAGMRPAGFVNAVLRRVSTRTQAEWLEIIAPDRATDPIGYLAATCSYPRWIVEAFRAALGEEPAGGLPETGAALAAGNVRPRITLAAVGGLADPKELIDEGAAEPAERARWSPFGVILHGGDPSAIPAVAEGRAFVQDEASQLAALALAHAPLSSPLAGPAAAPGPFPGPWLDLCAGPGGKSAVLAAVARRSAPRHPSGPAGPGRGPSGRLRRPPAPRRTDSGAPAPPAGRCRGGRRRPGRRLAARHVRPGARRRAVFWSRGAAPSPGSPLAQVTGRRRGARHPPALLAQRGHRRGPSRRRDRLRHLLPAPRRDPRRAPRRPGQPHRRCRPRRAHHPGGRPATRPAARRRKSRACAARTRTPATPSSGRTGTAPTPSSSPCSAAPRQLPTTPDVSGSGRG